MFVVEALRAKHGDCLLLHAGDAARPSLILVDGGPAGVFKDALRKRLDDLREERGLLLGEPLPIDLAMVSHIDEDHIAGLLEMTDRLQDLIANQMPEPWRIGRFWHNGFDDLVGNDEVGVAALPALGVASLGGSLAGHTSLLLASVPQGRNLGRALGALGLAGNAPFGGLVRQGVPPHRVDNLALTVVAPAADQLTALQKDWDKKIKPILKKEQDAAGRAEVAAYLDTSVYNLASIVVLVESDAGAKLLLTGDGSGNHTLSGLEAAGKLAPGGELSLDVLKVPHHGSERNVEPAYFERLPAAHYVISANGRDDNPDVATLRMISAARPDDDFTIHLTYPTDEFKVPQVGAAIADFFAAERAAGRQYQVATRNPGALSLRIELE